MKESSVLKCIFLRESIEDAQNEEQIIEAAEYCGCGGECTLEDGCVLYKLRQELPEEGKFFNCLKGEFLSHMLGE